MSLGWVAYVSVLLVFDSTMLGPGSLTFPFALGTSTNVLHHSDVSSTLRGATMSFLFSLFNSSLKGFEVCTPCILEAPTMADCLALAATNMCNQSNQFH